MCLYVCQPGAQDDLKQVTDLARRMVTVFGMSPTIGNVSYPTSEELGMETRPYSNHLATEIDRVRWFICCHVSVM